MTKDLKIIVFQNIINAIALGFFLYGFFSHNNALAIIGGIGMTLFLLTIFGKELNPITPLLLALILGFIIKPWYYGVFWVWSGFSVFQVFSFIFVSLTKRKEIQDAEKFFKNGIDYKEKNER
jgi:hypothetical protein